MESMKFSNKLKIGLLYFLLISGGTWHVLGVFQSLMDSIASILIIALGIWLFYENYCRLALSERGKFNLWSLLVISTSIGIEWVGVKTGGIFGAYQYGTNLPPYLNGVPLAIGFAWAGMLLASAGIVQKLLRPTFQNKLWIWAFFIAFFMTVFDLFMEPAAIRLKYWSWDSIHVPPQNYLAWFVVSYLYAYTGKKHFKIFTSVSPIGLHAYIAQLIYFLLIYLS